MSQRLPLPAIFLFVSFWILGSLARGGETHKNVLFIVADDLNCMIGPYEDHLAITPYLDRLADRGVTFFNAYCQQSVCNPSRASFLTGRYPDDTGVVDLQTHFREKLPDAVTLPQAFRSQGYHSECIGKIFHNNESTNDRKSWSVDEYLSAGRHADDTVYAQSPRPDGKPKIKAPVTEAHDVPDATYFDGRITERAVQALSQKKSKGRPFFLAVGYWRPHLPFVAPKKYWDLYDPKQIPDADPLLPPADAPPIALHANREILGYGYQFEKQINAKRRVHYRHAYYASISFLDAQIGKLLDALEEEGLANQTTIVFTSDHGFHLGEHGLWAKTTNFELDARVPLIIADPSHPQTFGDRSPGIVELVDLFPTLAELANLELPPGPVGNSLVPLLGDPFASAKEYAFTQHQRPFYGKSPVTHWGFSVRSKQWRYTQWLNAKSLEVEARELYKHTGDHRETANVAEYHPEVVAGLSKVLASHFDKLSSGPK